MQPPASLPGRGLVRPQRLMPVLGVSGVSRLSRGRVSTGGALQCRATAACFGYIHLQQYPEIHMPVELARKALAASLALSEGTGSSVPLVHHSIIQGAPNGATLWLTTVCALSVALAALIFNLFSVLASWQAQATQVEEKRHILYGIDVTNSRFFKDERVLAAVEFAATAHAGQIRKTGEPYVSHCVETALIVEHNLPPAAEYERYVKAIMASILHDVIDDTSVDLSTIKAQFGSQVASMVSQVSKLSQMNQLLRRGKRKGWAEYGPQHFKALRKMIVDMVFEEPLVILIKLADRLHNMRTVFVLKPEKQKAVAEETMEVWCTMAECLGWDALKSEMEDLCFAVLQPEQYCALRAQLDKIWSLPSLKVVMDQADSSSLPANALAPAPPFSVRGRKVAAASAARKAAAAAQAAMKALVPSTAGLAKQPASVPASSAPSVSSLSTLDESDRDLNLGIRIVAVPRGSLDEGDVGTSVLTSLPSGAAQQTQQQTPDAIASWDLVNWSMDEGTPEVQPVDRSSGAATPGPRSLKSARHTHPDVLLQAWAGTLPSSTVQEVTAAAVEALVSSDTDSIHTAATTIPAAQAEPALAAAAAHRQRLHSHSEAGPGPSSSMSTTASTTSTHTNTSSLSSHSSTSSNSSGSGSGGGSWGWGSPTATATVAATAVAEPAVAAASGGGGSRGGTATLTRPAVTKLLTAEEIEEVLSGGGQTVASTSSVGTSANASSVAASTAAAATVSKSPARSKSPSSTPLAPILYTQEQLAASFALPQLPTPPPPSSPPPPSAVPRAAGAVASGSGLTPQQERLKSLLSTVVPFDSVNFKDSRGLAMSTRRGLEVLDECAELLYAEVQLRSSGGGLSLRIQGRLKSLHSVYRKMVRKGCSVAEVYDARALRVIVGDDGGTRVRDSIEACYKLVSTVHSIWKPIPNEFDDYIANPKPSGYQALHTAVKGPGGVPMEVQIKTASMHELAEYGAAAHWVYKEYAHSVMMPAITPSPIGVAAAAAPGRLAAGGSSATIAEGAVVAAAAATPSSVPGFVPVRRFKGRGWAGQPVLRIAKDKLRYGAVISAENEGRNLLVAIKSGPTSEAYPTRAPDYIFYRSLMDYAQAKGWCIPGCSDFTLRLEEYVLANDGRYHRKDHMGYVLPQELITLLEGYEEDADAADRAAFLAARAADGHHHHQPHHAPAAELATAATAAADSGAGALSAFTASTEEDSGAGAAGAAAGDASSDPVADRLRRQMQEAYLRTQQLRTMIEWGRAAMGRYHQGGAEPGDEVSVLVWPGGTIEHWPRGTTVAQLVRAKGIITLSGLPEPPEIRPSATSILGGDDGWAYVRDAVDGLEKPPVPMVNVNNRLVREDSVLNDGDLVILAREKVRI